MTSVRVLGQIWILCRVLFIHRKTGTLLFPSSSSSHHLDIVKASSGPRYIVGCRNRVPKDKLKQGARVALDMTTLTIMRILPREVDPLVYNMSIEDPGNASFAGIGGLGEQIRELREVRAESFLSTGTPRTRF